MFGKSVPKLEMIEPKPMTDKQVKDRLRLASAEVRRAPAAGAQSTGDDGFVASMATGFPTQGTAAAVVGASLGQAMQSTSSETTYSSSSDSSSSSFDSGSSSSSDGSSY